MLNYQLENMGDESVSVTSIDHNAEFHVILLSNALFIDRCAHIWIKSDYETKQTLIWIIRFYDL